MKGFLFVSAISLFTLVSQAQTLYIDTVHVNSPYITSINDTFLLDIRLTALDSQSNPVAFNGLAEMHYLTNTMINQSIPAVIFDTLAVSITANNGFIDTATLEIVVDPQNFVVGGNIIIVWPTSVSIPTGDSIIIDITVDGFFNLDQEATHYIAYPNPASHWVTLTSANTNFSNITLMGADGRSLASFPYPSGTSKAEVDLSAYPPGNYLLQVLFNNGDKKTIMVIRQ